MTTFPALVPSGRTFTPGRHDHSLLRSMGGGITTVRHSDVITGQRLSLLFKLLTGDQRALILAHYLNRRGRFSTFSLPAEAWSGTTDQTPAGYVWRYTGRPRTVDVRCGRYDVEVEFEMERRHLPAIPTGDVVASSPVMATITAALAPQIKGATVVSIPLALTVSEAFPPSTPGRVLIPSIATVTEALAPIIPGRVMVPAAATTSTALAPTIARGGPVAVPAMATTTTALVPTARLGVFVSVPSMATATTRHAPTVQGAATVLVPTARTATTLHIPTV